MPALDLAVTAGCLYRECVSWGDEQGSEFRVLLLPRPSLASVDGRMGLFLSLPGPLGQMGGRVLTLFCGLPSPGLALSAYSTRWWQGGIQSNCFVRSAVPCQVGKSARLELVKFESRQTWKISEVGQLVRLESL